ncbi:MAG TPA: Lrp/AsnC family transcriptional regulator [Balneolaceae bacterium]|nr:Lrp/AsnC family transcriptional regulator [Balneolaceae bacterium]
MPRGLDKIDLQILQHLQIKGRAQRNKLSEIVGLSVPSVSERMRKLEEKDLIQGYHAELNAKKFNFDITAFVFVEVDGSSNYKNIVEKAREETEILECHSITGNGSHLLKIRSKNTETFEELLSKIQSWEGVKQTRSNIVLSSYKETHNIPVEKTIELKDK